MGSLVLKKSKETTIWNLKDKEIQLKKKKKKNSLYGENCNHWQSFFYWLHISEREHSTFQQLPLFNGQSATQVRTDVKYSVVALRGNTCELHFYHMIS